MPHLSALYRLPLALLTDLYQLTMSFGYWKLGRADRRAAFHLFFRRPPFCGGYAVWAGLDQVLDFLQAYQFDESDVTYLSTLQGNDGQPLFTEDFLSELLRLRLTVDVDAMAEGTVVFGQEPLLRVTGPIMQCQLLETALLNLVNFQTLIATKAARICTAAGDDEVIEFGLRRAQGIDGGVSASRAAFIGGCSSTSNLLAGKLYGIPVRGTHAHSWIMSFDSEAAAFAGYAEAMPNNCVFLVDTYDTLQGVREAIVVGKKLRESGHRLVGIRLDSGDLAHLSIEARRLLDDAGFADALIVASNDLDERIIESLKQQGAAIAVWGVGTRLATAFEQPALGGVFKLGAVQDDDGQWQSKLKLSEQTVKTTIPGILQVRRYRKVDGFVADMIYDETAGIDPRSSIVDLVDSSRRVTVPADAAGEDLLKPVVRAGRPVAECEDLEVLRNRARDQLGLLAPGVRRFLNPHEYRVGLDIGLFEQRAEMIAHQRAVRPSEPAQL